jgi:AcrR family transcriptional regulator
VSTEFQRARNEQQRAIRREAILSTAAHMLEHTRVSDLTLNELARQVGLAKSNVLRYFESREAVLLELYDREYRSWLDALDAALSGLSNVEDIADAIADSVVRRPVFSDLCASAPGVLEHNVSGEVARDYKLAAIANAEHLGEAVLPRIGEFTREAGITFVGGMNLIIGGTWAATQPSAGMAAAYASYPDLLAMQWNLRVAIRELTATLLIGLLNRKSRT